MNSLIIGSVTLVVLIKEVIEYDGMGLKQKKQIATNAMGVVKSIGAKEYWLSSSQNNIRPELSVDISLFDYDFQRKCSIDGSMFDVYRTYVNGDTITLYLTEAQANA